MMTHNGLPLENDLSRWMQDHLFDEVPITVALIDREYQMVTANRKFEEVFGEGGGKPCFEVICGRKTACTDCALARTFQDGKSRVQRKVCRSKDGKTASLMVHISPVMGDAGEVKYVAEMCLDVTELTKVQSEFEILFERVPSYIAVIEPDYKVARCNERMRQTFGEATGLPCYEVYKKRISKCPDCPVEKTFADGKIHQAEQLGETREGKMTRYLVKSAPITDENGNVVRVIEMSTDVTHLYEMEQNLANMDAFQTALIHNSYDAILAADDDGKIRVFNAAAQRLLKISAGDVSRMSDIEDYLPQEFSRMLNAEMGTCLLPETKITRKDGTLIPVRFAGVMLKDHARTLGSVAFIQDLRRIKELEREKVEAERLAAVGQTVAGLAHGVKNILTGLEGGLYVLKSGIRAGENDVIEDGWGMLENNIGRVSRMVQDFLAFSKGHDPDVKQVSPVEIAEEIVQLYRDRAKEVGVHLSCHVETGVASAYLDAEAIHTCIANLVANAIDACLMSERKPGNVEIRCRDHGDDLIYEVADDGVGMDFEIKKKAFTNFFTTKGKGGTGIGLLVTRKIVQEHGGYIDLDSEPSRGTTFRLVFPRKRLMSLQERKHSEESKDDSEQKGETLWQLQ